MADYDEVMETTGFDSGSDNGAVACVDVSIQDNMAFEKTESFVLHLSVELGVSNVWVDLGYTKIIIFDDDRMSEIGLHINLSLRYFLQISTCHLFKMCMR